MWSERKGPKNEEQTIYIPILLGGGSWFLLHDNAPAHQSVLVKDFLAMICDNTGPFPTLLTWLQQIFTCSLW